MGRVRQTIWSAEIREERRGGGSERGRGRVDGEDSKNGKGSQVCRDTGRDVEDKKRKRRKVWKEVEMKLRRASVLRVSACGCRGRFFVLFLSRFVQRTV